MDPAIIGAIITATVAGVIAIAVAMMARRGARGTEVPPPTQAVAQLHPPKPRAEPTEFRGSVDALHQIPAPPADFTGREAELQELLTAIQQGGATISGLQGMGGIGKTALAFKLAAELEDRYPDAQIYLDLHGASEQQPLSPPDAMAHVVRSFEPAAQLPNDETELMPRYQSTLHGKRVLLLMDNASGAEQVEPLIPPAGCALLVTSRQHFTLPGLFARDLDTLPPNDPRALLLTIAPRIGEQANAIAGLCGHLPHALRLAASALAERPDLAIEDYVERLRASPLDERVEASLALSYDILDTEAQSLWRALAVFPESFDAQAAAAVWAAEPPGTQDALSELLRHNMVEWNEATRRYRLHDLARASADRCLADDERLEAARRHAEHYMSVLEEANRLYLEGSESLVGGLTLFDLERANVEAGQAWAASFVEADDSATRLSNAYPNAGIYVLELRLHTRRQIGWLEAATAAARRLGDPRAESGHTANLGNAYAQLGESRRAIEYYEQALAISRNIGDRSSEGNVLGNLGIAYRHLDEPRRAIVYHEQALSISRDIGDRRSESQDLGSLGNAYAALGERRRAIEYYEQTLIIHREVGDRRGEGNDLGNLGRAYAALHEPRLAIEYHDQALTISRLIGDRRGEGAVLFNVAVALDQLGERNRAKESAEASLAILEAIEDPNADMVRETLVEWRGTAG